jgi:hypothetical protein
MEKGRLKGDENMDVPAASFSTPFDCWLERSSDSTLRCPSGSEFRKMGDDSLTHAVTSASARHL